MRYLILSDIHGNRLALDAVLKHARGAYDAALCCGDLVGYGAEPNEVVDWARANLTSCIRGNHDKAAAGLEDLEWFNPAARHAAVWTGQALTPENLDYLRALPRGPIVFDVFQILHGSPLDEDDYLVSITSAIQLRNYLERPVSLFGHTHLQGGFLVHRNGGKRLPKIPESSEAEVLELDPDAWYMINPGSVGQPRDGDPRAAYALYEPESRLVEYRRVPYDVRAAQEKILRAGLPEMLAERLELGS